MEPCKEMGTIDKEILAKLRPMTVDHHNSLLYDGLRSCMEKNTNLHIMLAETQQQLLTALETISKLTEELRACKASSNHSGCC